MMYKWNPERALELIERERVTNFVGVPTMSWDLLESPDFAKRDTSSLRRVGGGGAPAPPELVKRIDNSFAKGRPDIGYGMTETNAYGPQNTGDDYVRKPTQRGPHRAGRRGARRPTTTAARSAGGEVGEIWFRGPQPDPRLLEQARGHRRDDRRRLAAQRRHRPHRRRGLRLRRGPRQGHGDPRRREHLLRRGRGGDLRAPGGVRGGRVRPAARAARRGGRGGGPPASRARSSATGELQAHLREAARGVQGAEPSSSSPSGSSRATRRARS